MNLRLTSYSILIFLLLSCLKLWAKPPEGFQYHVLTDDVPMARQMAESKNGMLYVGSFAAGVVYAVSGVHAKGSVEITIVDEGLTVPTGVAMLGDDLIVAALNKVLRYRDIDSNYAKDPEPEVITDALPDRRHHGWKYLSVGPDGYLYVPVGAPCNICESRDERFASILRMNPVTGQTTVYARGVRNSVGMTWHPNTQQLWFSDNGRDMMGDDVPHEEINVVTEAGRHYGYPYVHAGDVRDPEFGKNVNPEEYVRPKMNIQAHSAALGLDFYTHSKFPARYQGALFIAEHGSWNRSSKVGYRVSVVVDSDEGFVLEPFIDHWLEGERVSGRPNDVLVLSDGTLLISDDHRGAIYRVSYGED